MAERVSYGLMKQWQRHRYMKAMDVTVFYVTDDQQVIAGGTIHKLLYHFAETHFWTLFELAILNFC